MQHANVPRRARRARGFTLMEMLLVLAILVLLMALVGPRILGTQRKSDVGAAKTQMGMLKAALEHYALDMKTFPSTEQGLQSLIEAPDEAENKGKWDGPYLDAEAVPADPWSHPYQYQYPPSHGKRDFPDLWSFGPDGSDGTEDDIANWASADDGKEGAVASADSKRK